MVTVGSDVKRVRLVEDVVELAHLFKLNLEELGYNVVTSTREFERLLTPDPWNEVDVAVVDIMLPGVSGEEILRYLHDQHPHIKRIAMTASLVHAERALGLADRVLIKPFSTDDLLDSL